MVSATDKFALAEFDVDSIEPVVVEDVVEAVPEIDTAAPAVELAVVEFDLDSLEPSVISDDVASTIPKRGRIDNTEGEFDLADLDLDLLEIPKELSIETPESLNTTTSLAEELSDVAFTENVPLPKVDKDDTDTFIDIETLLEGCSSEDENVEFNLGLDECTEIHSEDINEIENEISAKIDLARAYLEIDDKSGAKEILDQLLEKAESQQKAEIEKLLSKLT